MNKGLQHFGRQTAIYTIGNLIHRGASFVLVPLYAHTLPVAEYGRLELLATTMFVLQFVFSSGVSHAVMRFYLEYDDDRANKVVTTALLTSFAFSSVGTLLVFLSASWLSSLIYGSPDFASAFTIAAITMTLEISREISLSVLRAREKPIMFMAAGGVQFLTQVGASYYMVVVRHWGMQGVLVANLVAVSAVWIVLTYTTLSHCGVKYDLRLLKPLFKYGVPMMLTSLNVAAFSSIDRYALNAFTTLIEIGQYALGLRIVTAVTALIVEPFKTSYGPFRLTIMKQPTAKEIYSRVLTYYLMGVSAIVVTIAVFSREIVHLSSQPEYWPATRLIPFLLISPLLSGVDYCLQTGVLIERKTLSMFYATFVKGAFGLSTIFWLLPKYGAQGAALAAMLNGLFGVSVTYFVAQRVYPIRFEYARIGKIVGSALVVGVAAYAIPAESLSTALAAKGLVLLTLPFVLLLSGGLHVEELRQVGTYVMRRLGLQPETKMPLREVEIQPRENV